MSTAAPYLVPAPKRRRTREQALPNNLLALMREHGITQQRLADAAGCDQSSVSLYASRERGPSVPMGWAFVRALSSLTGQPLTFEQVWPCPSRDLPGNGPGCLLAVSQGISSRGRDRSESAS